MAQDGVEGLFDLARTIALADSYFKAVAEKNGSLVIEYNNGQVLVTIGERQGVGDTFVDALYKSRKNYNCYNETLPKEQ